MTRDEHLQWCKDRALEYLPGDPKNAAASMLSDLDKHEGTKSSVRVGIMVMPALYGQGDNPREVRKWIEGFN